MDKFKSVELFVDSLFEDDEEGKIKTLRSLSASSLIGLVKFDRGKGIEFIVAIFSWMPRVIEGALFVFKIIEGIGLLIRPVTVHASWVLSSTTENLLDRLKDSLETEGERGEGDVETKTLISDLLLIVKHLHFRFLVDEFEFDILALHDFELDVTDRDNTNTYLRLLEMIFHLPKTKETQEMFEYFMDDCIKDMASLCPLFFESENCWIFGLGSVYRSKLAWCLVSQIDDGVEDHLLMINRSDILGSSKNELLSATINQLRKGVKVQYVDEIGEGHGVTRDWFTVLAKEIVQSKEKPFNTSESDSTRIYPRKGSGLDPMFYKFCGRLFGLAITHQVQIGYTFSNVLFVQLCGHEVELEDIEESALSQYNAYSFVLSIDSVEMDETEFFFPEDCDGMESVGTKVTMENREKYVSSGIDSDFGTGIHDAVANLIVGMDDVLTCQGRKYFLEIMSFEDLTLALRGIPDLDVKEWKDCTTYELYDENDKRIKWFWDWLGALSAEDRADFFGFWTSRTWLPAGGFKAIDPPLLIREKLLTSKEELFCFPSVQTCVTALDIPRYDSEEDLCRSLQLALKNHKMTSGAFHRV